DAHHWIHGLLELELLDLRAVLARALGQPDGRKVRRAAGPGPLGGSAERLAKLGSANGHIRPFVPRVAALCAMGATPPLATRWPARCFSPREGMAALGRVAAGFRGPGTVGGSTDAPQDEMALRAGPDARASSEPGSRAPVADRDASAGL